MLFVDLWQSPILGFTHYETCLENTYGASNYNPLPVVLKNAKGVYVWDIILN